MIVTRKTRSNLEFNTVESLIPVCKSVSKEFKSFTQITQPLFDSLIDENFDSMEKLKERIRQILNISRGTKDKSYYFNSLGWNENEWEIKQRFYSERAIKRCRNTQ